VPPTLYGAGMSDSPAACLIGWPAAHSRSPVIHKYWLKTLGILGDYRIEAVKPEAFATFIGDLPARGYVGANVTIPHKEQALTLADGDGRARAVGAANTLWFEGGKLRATNTDVEGFVANLDASAPGWDRVGGEALVLGAGGSSHAVIFGLLERGIGVVHLANRTRERADVLAAKFGTRVHPVDWGAVDSFLPRASLLANTTPLGMAGHPLLTLHVAGLADDAVVADLVYAPMQTPLLVAARARGLRTADGLGMLLHQAVRGFALWFGQTPEVNAELRALVEADLTK
jgi:shikimate dehydrogenase